MIDKPAVVFLNTNGVFLLIILAFSYFWFFKEEKKEALRVIFSVLIAGSLAIFLKELFNLPRPYAVDNLTPLAGLRQLSGFPSVHSALAFSVATSVSLRKKSFGLLLIVLAIIIGLGRILANVHYPIDVIFGVVIGVIIAVFIEQLRFPKLGRLAKIKKSRA